MISYQAFNQKQILVALSGGIAAYKIPELIRLLRAAGADVRVLMTKNAAQFITPLTLQAVSGNPVHWGLFSKAGNDAMDHIELARWADLVIVAPASANCIARLAQGFADDLLTTVCLATQASIAVAPAMNQQMWQNRLVQTNVEKLKQNQFLIWGPGEGEQACGEIGRGRMLEPQELCDFAQQAWTAKILNGKKWIVTAGPTQEALDPVRFLSNHSSGKMGYALAEAAAEQGADVLLVSGPTALPTPLKVKRINITTAQEMYAVVMQHIEACDTFVAAAAVADYRPAEILEHKLKKSDDDFMLRLTRNPDILQAVGALPSKPFIIGFAAETQDVVSNARIKMQRKNVDLMVANVVGDGRGFGVDQNEVTLIFVDGKTEVLPMQSKRSLAQQIISSILLFVAPHCRA